MGDEIARRGRKDAGVTDRLDSEQPGGIEDRVREREPSVPGEVNINEKRQLSAVFEIANMINSQIDLGQILSSIAREFSKVLDFDLGCVAIHDKGDNCLYLRHVYRRNGDKTAEGRYVPLEESNLVGWVAINRQPILRKDIASDYRFNEIMKEDSLGSDIVVPLLAKGVLIGTVNFGSYQSGHYTEFDLQLVKDFSNLISIAIEKAQLLEELNELGDKFRNLMRAANDLIMMLDMSGDIVECNDAIFRIMGYGREEVIGRSPSEFSPPARREIVRTNFGKILRGEITRAIEVPYLKKNGELVYLDVNLNIVRVKEHPYVIFVGHDVTDRKMLEEKITIQNRELQENNRKLLEVDRLKSEFLGRISHELRTPLSVIMAYTGTLIEDADDSIDAATRHDFLEVIEDQSNKLLVLINDLLDLSKVEISDTMLDVTEGSINDMIKGSMAIVAPLSRRHGVEIAANLDHSIPITRFDPLRVRQICVNLLNNAIKFTPRGEKVLISSLLAGNEAIVSISDSGPGIDKDHLARIFENFTQVDGSATRTRNGMGIGLRLVKHYIELHHGRIWVESERGKGSTFHFSIPLTPDLTGVPAGDKAVPSSC